MTVEKLANATVRPLAEKVSYCHYKVCRDPKILTTRMYLSRCHTFSATLMIRIMNMMVVMLKIAFSWSKGCVCAPTCSQSNRLQRCIGIIALLDRLLATIVKHH